MKKLLFTSLLFVISYGSFAQAHVGLTFSPAISASRTKYVSDTISQNGNSLLFKFGLEFDFELADNYSFSTGLLFAPKRLSLKVEGDTDRFEEEYRIQYLQIPVTLKLFTTEIQPNLKLFFQLGFLGDIKIFSEPLDNDYVLVEDFWFYDISFVGGVGVEYGAGVNTVVYAGFFYERGLVDIVKNTGDLISEDLQARTSLTSLKLGLKF